ncbi:synaptotagmin-like protein 3 isoform X1 [Cottoperca gobio]|uniref:Synaptotagmin-like protein 3 isoform X1 n=1 Tax=Cottoperca gobio TaxID=56716 RepID=A0A6J2S582_COTGO|nr:synaptotagmin-like protein 3 isoform X1 [Cottoperca gobio]XP_029318428.1 synaptotagmin-like protein 3 isoform X1 [Cottoperca gobio]
MITDCCCSKMDLTSLQALERERVLEVLRRDKQLRTIEEDRIRRMKHDLQELRRRGAKSFARQYGERTCARCQRPLGKFWNSGEVCSGCSHRICSKCRVGAADWKCTVCYAYREVKFRSGEWFLEEKAKKFPVTTDKYEMVGEKLLKSYNVLSDISVVPPTPPPYLLSDYQFLSRSGDLKNSKPFTKSMEDLMVSFTSHIKKISTSQNDVRGDLLRVDSSQRETCSHYTQMSLSDTDINKTSTLFKGPSLPNLFKKSKDSDLEGSSTGAEEETSCGSEYSGGKRGSSSSMMSLDCGLIESIVVAGELELALAYNTHTSRLEITVGTCRNLSYGDTKRKKCRPYVKLYVLPGNSSKMKTTVKKNTTDPVYNEVFKYPHRAPPAVWKETAGLCVAFRNPEKEGVSRRGPFPAGWLEI